MTASDIGRLLGSDGDQRRAAAWWNASKRAASPAPTDEQLATAAAIDEEIALLETFAAIQKAKA